MLVFMESQIQKDLNRLLTRPEDGGLTVHEIIVVYRFLVEEKREEVSKMTPLEAIEKFKEILLRLV
jgi:hypothetical protein